MGFQSLAKGKQTTRLSHHDQPELPTILLCYLASINSRGEAAGGIFHPEESKETGIWGRATSDRAADHAA